MKCELKFSVLGQPAFQNLSNVQTDRMLVCGIILN